MYTRTRVPGGESQDRRQVRMKIELSCRVFSGFGRFLQSAAVIQTMGVARVVVVDVVVLLIYPARVTGGVRAC